MIYIEKLPCAKLLYSSSKEQEMVKPKKWQILFWKKCNMKKSLILEKTSVGTIFLTQDEYNNFYVRVLP